MKLIINWKIISASLSYLDIVVDNKKHVLIVFFIQYFNFGWLASLQGSLVSEQLIDWCFTYVQQGI